MGIADYVSTRVHLYCMLVKHAEYDHVKKKVKGSEPKKQ
jgi:hypothetical protein